MRAFRYHAYVHDESGFVLARTSFVLLRNERLMLDKDQDNKELLVHVAKVKFSAAENVALSGKGLTDQIKIAKEKGRVVFAWEESDGTIHWGEVNLPRFGSVQI